MTVSRDTSGVRLTEAEVQSILAAVRDVAKQKEIIIKEISLFGSRTDVSKKGGDIDLYILLSEKVLKNRNGFKRELRLALENKLGEQKIDIVLDDGGINLRNFKEIIKPSKVILWPKKT